MRLVNDGQVGFGNICYYDFEYDWPFVTYWLLPLLPRLKAYRQYSDFYEEALSRGDMVEICKIDGLHGYQISLFRKEPSKDFSYKDDQQSRKLYIDSSSVGTSVCSCCASGMIISTSDVRIDTDLPIQVGFNLSQYILDSIEPHPNILIENGVVFIFSLLRNLEWRI